MVEGNRFLVGQIDPQHGHRHQARFLDHKIRDGERAQSTGKKKNAVQMIGNPELLNDQSQEPADHRSKDATDQGGKHQDAGGRHDLLIRVTGMKHGFKNQHCQDGADGVDNDAFPFHDRSDVPRGTNVADHRCDDGRTCDHKDRSKKDG